jgi:hypothetical protein
LSAEVIDCPSLGDCRQPGGWIVRDPRLGPLFQRGDQCALRQFLSQAHISHHPADDGDQPRRLDAPDGVNNP